MVIGYFNLGMLRAAATLHGVVSPGDLWSAWSFEPATVLALGATAFAYALGTYRVWHAASVGRGIRRRDAWAFGVGWLLLVLSQVSPLHALSEVLFSAHMVQHEVLMTLAAPLLVLGKPLIAFVWALSPRWRRITGDWSGSRPVAATWNVLTHPLAAFLFHGAAIWIWHLPSLYDATVSSEWVHTAQHMSFLATALLFWWVVLEPLRAHRNPLVAVAVLFATVLHTGALGALLTLTSRVLYPAYAATSATWGLSAVDDQQLGGIIMWVPGSLAYVVFGLLLGARAIHGSEQRAVAGVSRDRSAGVAQEPRLRRITP